MTPVATITGRAPATGGGVAVTVADGLITAVAPTDVADEAPYLSAGLVDLQINGYGGVDLNSGDVTSETVLELCRRVAATGVTSFLPTLITAAEADLVTALAAIAEARRHHLLAERMVAGVHVEGPAISPLDGPRGAHPLAHVRPPSLAEFGRWQAAAEGLVRLVTLAPESRGAVEYVAALTARGVHVALGHTAATPEQVRAAADAGAVLSTHLGNGAAAVLPRHPNFIWAQLADDRLTASFIADGHHLPADTLTAMLRAKGLERSVLVSDAVALAGMPPGTYEQGVGGRVEVAANGRVGVAGTPYLAGAGLPLSANVAIAVAMSGISLADGLRLATVNPGRFLGGRGRLEAGARADLLAFDWIPGSDRLAIRDVWVAGEPVGTP